MYAAIAGLRCHMSALNVVGNNVANVNTLGYKATRYTFDEALYTTSRSGSNGTAIVGGRNPAQIGYGANIGTIDLDMSTKNYAETGMALDCMIDGDGFFIVGDKTNLSIQTQNQLQGMDLTRLGRFGFDEGGYLVDGDGNVVYGFLAKPKATDEGYEAIPILTPIRYPMCTISKKETVDEDGNPIIMSETTVHSPTVTDDGDVVDAHQVQGVDAEAAKKMERLQPQTVAIEQGTGRITCITKDGQSVTVGYLALAQVDNPNGVTHTDGRYYKAMGGAGDVHLSSFGGVVQHVPDQQGDAAPDPTKGALTIEAGGDTTLYTGGLESSGTDLAREITNMITLQRGYQANTRIITVTDSMPEELVNMKR